MGTTLNTLMKEDVLSLEYVESRTNKLDNGKAKDIKGYQDESLKWEDLCPFLISIRF